MVVITFQIQIYIARKLIRHSELKKKVEEKIKAMSFMGKDRDGVCDNWKHGVGGQKVARMLIAATSKVLYFITIG